MGQARGRAAENSDESWGPDVQLYPICTPGAEKRGLEKQDCTLQATDLCSPGPKREGQDVLIRAFQMTGQWGMRIPQ